MKRIAFSICIAIAALCLGACEKQSADNLPDKYRPKSDASPAPAHDDKAKAPDAAHKG